MPLMSLTRVHKSFPPTFAEGFKQHAKERRENSKIKTKAGQHDVVRREQLKKKQTEEVVFSSNEDNVIKRQRTPVKESESTMKSTSGPPDDISSLNHRDVGQSRTHSGQIGDVICNDMTSWWAFRPRSRDLNSRGGRTTVSLETVDLWESDSEEQSENTVENTGYDKINGVTINPRKTFDFSELRRRGDSSLAGEGNAGRRSRKHVRQSEKLLKKFDESSAKSQHNNNAYKQHKYSCKDNEKISTNDLCSSDIDSYSDKSHHHAAPKKKSVAERIEEIKMKNGHKLKQKDHEKDHLTHKTEPQKERTSECSNPRQKSDSAEKEVKIERQTTSALKVKPRVNVVPGLEHVFPSHRKLDNKQQNLANKCVQSVADLQMNKMADISLAEQTFPPASQKRRVKFNKVVSVREDGQNKLDFLRTSKNSAQTFKQRYLSGIPARIMEEARPTTPTPDRGSCVQLAY